MWLIPTTNVFFQNCGQTSSGLGEGAILDLAVYFQTRLYFRGGEYRL